MYFLRFPVTCTFLNIVRPNLCQLNLTTLIHKAKLLNVNLATLLFDLPTIISGVKIRFMDLKDACRSSGFLLVRRVMGMDRVAFLKSHISDKQHIYHDDKVIFGMGYY